MSRWWNGTSIWGGYIGPIPTNCSLQKCLEEAQVALGQDQSAMPPSPSGHTCILEPLGLSSWATLDSAAHPSSWKPLRSFVWPRPTEAPIQMCGSQALGEVTTILSEPRLLLLQPSLIQVQNISALKKSFWRLPW